MFGKKPLRLAIVHSLPLTLMAFCAVTAEAQVKEVVVGITTTCPYERAIEGSCWSGAYWALMELRGIKSVDKSANGYNCTARVYLNDNVFPDPNQWAGQFKKSVGQTYTFRGIEMTVRGTVDDGDRGLVLRIPCIEQPITIAPLEHKLQWNSTKGAARQPEPDERDAFQQLVAKKKDAGAKQLSGVQVTGPLLKTDKGYVLEVREFLVRNPESSVPPAK
jgi:hypothetical protein